MLGITTVQRVPLFLLRWSIAYLIGYSLSYPSPHRKVTRSDWVRGIVTKSDRGVGGIVSLSIGVRRDLKNLTGIEDNTV
ncbi:hypothetical protein F5B19DRAFT_452864 [Rostrohypoxylon terebratum]|nr:hypothetical protein F5B19DRAFT_452864 [Rostrohypoxylon terebratum]